MSLFPPLTLELSLLSAVSLLESMGAHIQSGAVHLKKDVSIPLAGTHKKLEPPSWLTREAPPACDQAGLQP